MRRRFNSRMMLHAYECELCHASDAWRYEVSAEAMMALPELDIRGIVDKHWKDHVQEAHTMKITPVTFMDDASPPSPTATR